ncbi:unnamed protein product [Penicillium salamii]|uniref:Wings apart-like protein C-terminal domain-containing protein n=1 Tax=Penicillium salamii TaxID=1612424 RepID=A0A9W4NCE7_9EURO|nr:unnamed protein product [Penicillium salamii]CAG8333381.1 unnamed protein product [Penicillium salamii]CAG8359120.1 unnamed protein product [Penicillium salamii]CAG8369695.1 unnamed protein product [Penicillium salamii]
MDKPRTRNRRPVTCGTAKGQPRSNTNATTHLSPTRVTSKTKSVPVSSRLARSPNKISQSNKKEDQPSGSSGATPAPALAQSQSTTESNVYDLPSSGDEQTIIRRKRRRPSHDNSKHSPATKRAVRPRPPPSSKSRTVDDKDTVAPIKLEKPVPIREVPSVVLEKDQQKVNTGESSIFRAGRPARSKTERPAPEQVPRASAEERPEAFDSEPQGSPSTKWHHAVTENTTPGRKRLIDSLGAVTPAPDLSPKTPAASQEPPASTPRSPVSPNVPLDEGHLEHHVQASPTAGPSHLRSSGVTYARQRSFLDDMLLEDELTASNMPGLNHRSQSIQRQLAKEATSSAQLIGEMEETNDDGSVRSIHELRQAGGNARYRGAVESIFEDIEDAQNSTAGHCNALLQLCGKLMDTGLRRRFVECNFDKRLVDCLSMDLEVVPAALTFCAYALASSDGHTSFVHAATAWPKLLELSPKLLTTQDDLTEVAKSKTNGLARHSQKTLQNLVPRISDMLFPANSAVRISPCTLALYCLRITLSTMRTKGESPSKISSSLFEILMQLLVSESHQCVSQKSMPAESSQILCMVFSVLEAFTSSPESANDDYRGIMEPLSTLHGLFYLKSDYLDAISQQIQPLFIRVILNVTNSNPAICDEFAKQEIIGGLVHMVTANFGDLTEDMLGQENNTLDGVILALGALINMTEKSAMSRSTFLHSIGSGQPFLERLTHLFTTFADSISTAHSVVDVHHNVAVGYLAVLLLTLSLDNETRSRIKKLLAPNGLTLVVSTVEEFLQYHRKIEQEVSALPAQGQPASGFMARLQELIAQVRLAES